MALTTRKIAVTVNSRQYQGISVPSNNKSRTVFVAQYGSDVFCSGITKRKEVDAEALASFLFRSEQCHEEPRKLRSNLPRLRKTARWVSANIGADMGSESSCPCQVFRSI